MRQLQIAIRFEAILAALGKASPNARSAVERQTHGCAASRTTSIAEGETTFC
jgi:hypothetical protein